MKKKPKTKSHRDEYKIRQGKITIYKRTAQGTKYQSDNWYAAIKLSDQKLIRISLKTTDSSEAELIAENHYYDLLERSKRGLSIKSKKFSLCANSFIKNLTENVKREESLPAKEKRYKPTQLKSKKHIVEKYLIPYFKDKTLQEITDFDIEGYKEWRKMYWISGDGAHQKTVSYIRNGKKIIRPKNNAEKSEPSNNSVNKELTVIRDIYEYARLNRLIEGKEVPVIKNLRKPKNLNNKKSGLTEDEVTHLLNTTATRYYSQSNPKHKRHQKLLLHYIAFLCLTGLRVAEAKNLLISDCELYKKNGIEYLKVHVWGKGKQRELIGLEESPIVLEKLKTLHRENASIHSWEYTDKMPLFVDQYGKHIGSFSRSLNRAFTDANLLLDSNGIKRTAGAFRKYYITQALLVGKIKPIELAKQCGTSVNIIEEYYAEIDVKHTPSQFIFKNALTGVYDEH